MMMDLKRKYKPSRGNRSLKKGVRWRTFSLTDHRLRADPLAKISWRCLRDSHTTVKQEPVWGRSNDCVSGWIEGHGSENREQESCNFCHTDYAFSPFASSCFREAAEAVSDDAVHAPDEAFSTVGQSTAPESDDRARGPGARSALHTA